VLHPEQTICTERLGMSLTWNPSGAVAALMPFNAPGVVVAVPVFPQDKHSTRTSVLIARPIGKLCHRAEHSTTKTFVRFRTENRHRLPVSPSLLL
jgi:hypothetical protein